MPELCVEPPGGVNSTEHPTIHPPFNLKILDMVTRSHFLFMWMDFLCIVPTKERSDDRTQTDTTSKMDRLVCVSTTRGCNYKPHKKTYRAEMCPIFRQLDLIKTRLVFLMFDAQTSCFFLALQTLNTFPQ